MPGPSDLQDLAVELLDASIEALDAIPSLAPGLEGAPERAFVNPGRPALEGCDQLVVHVDSVIMAPLQPGGLLDGRRNVTGTLNHVRLVVTISRCLIDTRNQNSQIAMLEPRPTGDLQATAEQTNADGWALWNHLYWLWSSGGFLSICTELFFEGMRALPEEGDRAGWTLTLRATLNGYDDVPSS